MFRRRKNIEPKENPLQDKVAGKIAGSLIWVQTKFSEAMGKIFSKFDKRQLKASLVIFCMIGCGLSSYYFILAIKSNPKERIKIDHVSMPRHFDRTANEVMDGVMPEAIYQEIQQYRRYMDSIGEPIRQGMEDSMQILEELYLQQHKN